MEQWRNDDKQGKREEFEESLVTCHFVHCESELKSPGNKVWIKQSGTNILSDVAELMIIKSGIIL
jgi:hypothetical protein